MGLPFTSERSGVRIPHGAPSLGVIMSRHPMPTIDQLQPNDYPYVVTIRFRTTGEAEDALHELENEVRSVRYNENEIGQNIYFVDSSHDSIV